MSFSKLLDTPVDQYHYPRLHHRDLLHLFEQPAIASDVADAERIFTPPTPTSKPTDLFSVHINHCSVPGYRFIRHTNSQQMLMFVDGSSLGNGSPTASAGYGVVYAPLQWTDPFFERLEQDGNPQTNNRAELRAVLAALSLRLWLGEGFDKIVMACDSQYVVNGISQWILKWRKNGWKTSTRAKVANQDLWKKLEEKLRELEQRGMLVQFWWIPREWNEADAYAKAGAEKDDVIGEVEDVTTVERILAGSLIVS